MDGDYLRRGVAEFLGAFALTFFGAGAIMVGSGGLIGVALAHGLAIGVMVSSVGHISGGHFNPAVTIGMLLTQKIKGKDAVGYFVAQFAGGIVGALLLDAALPDQFTKIAHLGTPGVSPGISNGQAVLIEAILTFFLVWVIFATAVDSEGSFNKIAGLAIGFTITLDILMGGAWTGAAMNPARFVGPALVDGTWTSWWVYFIGPIAGSIVAAVLYDSLMIRRPGSAAAGEVAHGTGAHGEETSRTDM